MDHDVMHKDVAGLKKFRDRAEKAIAFIEGLQAAGFNPQGGAAPQLNEDQVALVREQFSEIIKPVSDAIDIKLNSFDDRLKSIEKAQNTSSLVALEDRVKALEGMKADTGDVTERLNAMLDWFDANREGLEVLLSLDGDVDDQTGQTDNAGTDRSGSGGSAPGTGTSGLAAGEAVSGSGAVAGDVITGGPNAGAQEVAEPVAGADKA